MLFGWKICLKIYYLLKLFPVINILKTMIIEL